MSSIFIGSGGSNIIGGTNVIRGNVDFSDRSGNGNNRVQGVRINGKGKYIINGKEYSSDQVTVRTEYKIKSTDETVYSEPNNITVYLSGGNYMKVDISSASGDIDVQCQSSGATFSSVKSSSGSIHVDGSATTVRTMSGDVSVKGNVQNVQTMSGNVRR